MSISDDEYSAIARGSLIFLLTAVSGLAAWWEGANPFGWSLVAFFAFGTFFALGVD